MRLIDADALKEELDSWVRCINKPHLYVREEALYIIDSAITIDIVKRGKWIKKVFNIDGEEEIGIVCSLCGQSKVAGIMAAKYCPKCGANMQDE